MARSPTTMARAWRGAPAAVRLAAQPAQLDDDRCLGAAAAGPVHAGGAVAANAYPPAGKASVQREHGFADVERGQLRAAALRGKARLRGGRRPGGGVVLQLQIGIERIRRLHLRGVGAHAVGQGAGQLHAVRQQCAAVAHALRRHLRAGLRTECRPTGRGWPPGRQAA
ncbi:hypothetical protein LP419_06240 [Massilia sp. H-1]|nr:hypothetical protein LP419_06240 [Massilia sp. H-1]